MGYLTNAPLKDQYRCEYAARESGMDVVFKQHPMPKNPHDPEDELYHPETLQDEYGSVFTNEGFVDHSDFWDAWEAYES